MYVRLSLSPINGFNVCSPHNKSSLMIIDLFVCLSVALTCNLSFILCHFILKVLKKKPYKNQLCVKRRRNEQTRVKELKLPSTSKLNQNLKVNRISSDLGYRTRLECLFSVFFNRHAGFSVAALENSAEKNRKLVQTHDTRKISETEENWSENE